MRLFQWIERWPRRRLLTAGLGILLAAGLLAGGWLYARSVRAARMAYTGPGIEQAQPQRWEGVPGVTVRPLDRLPDTGQLRPAPQGIPVTSGLMNCTYPSQYWSEHPEEWLTDNIVVGQVAFGRAEIQSLLGEEAGSTGAGLARQFLTVILNVVRGAESRSIDAVIEQAGAWLSAHYSKTSLTSAEIDQALSLMAGLEAFNRGETGPSTCAGVPRAYLVSSPTPTLEPTATTAPRPPAVSQAILSGSSPSNDSAGRDSGEEGEIIEVVSESPQVPPTAAPQAPEPTAIPDEVSPPPASPPGDHPGQGPGQDHGKDQDKGQGKDRGKGNDKGPKFKEKDDQFEKGPGSSPGPGGAPSQEKDKGKDKGPGSPHEHDKDKGKDHAPKEPKKGRGH